MPHNIVAETDFLLNCVCFFFADNVRVHYNISCLCGLKNFYIIEFFFVPTLHNWGCEDYSLDVFFGFRQFSYVTVFHITIYGLRTNILVTIDYCNNAL